MPKKKSRQPRTSASPKKGITGARPPFDLGRVVGTQRILKAFTATQLQAALQMYLAHHWGSHPYTSVSENERNARRNKGRISASVDYLGKVFWIITEGGEPGNEPRHTTLFFPDEN